MNTDGPECCGRKREEKGEREIKEEGSERGTWTRWRGVCSACSLTDLWISLLSARGWLRRLTRAASGFWIERGGNRESKVGRRERREEADDAGEEGSRRAV